MITIPTPTICGRPQRFIHEGHPVIIRYIPNLLDADWFRGSLVGLSLAPQVNWPALRTLDDEEDAA